MDLVQRIALIRSGIPATFVRRLLRSLDSKRIGLDDILKIKDQSLTRLARADRPLSQSASERIVEVAILVGQVEAMVEESGNPEGFDAAEWLSKWLDNPVPALDGRRPVAYLDTIKGMRLVSEMLRKMQSGAYA